MARVLLDEELRCEYQRLFETCVVNKDKVAGVEALIAGLMAHREDYQAVEDALGVPWHVAAVIHSLEREGRFDCHLHNGDPLTARTVHLPDGYPRQGEPPFTWMESALDALKLHHLNQWRDWTISGTLFKLEAYGGWNYRLFHPNVPTPYLWNYSNHYQSGKYIADGTWSNTAVTQECGGAVLLRRMAERGLITFPGVDDTPVICYSENGTMPGAVELQEFLNGFPGIFVKVDGWLGPRTSDAFRKLTGQYLMGDPRDAEIVEVLES